MGGRGKALTMMSSSWPGRMDGPVYSDEDFQDLPEAGLEAGRQEFENCRQRAGPQRM